MMFAMFSHNDFREKVTNVVHFPGISKLTFGQLLHYLYTDRVTSDRASTGLATSSILIQLHKKSLICLEGKSTTPWWGNTILFRSS